MEWRWKREGDERKWKLFARVSISGNVTRIKKKKRRSRFVLFQLSSSFDFLFKEFLASILCNLHNYNFIGFRIHRFLATGFEPVEAKNKKTPKDNVITEGNKIFRWKIPFFFFFFFTTTCFTHPDHGSETGQNPKKRKEKQSPIDLV